MKRHFIETDISRHFTRKEVKMVLKIYEQVLNLTHNKTNEVFFLGNKELQV